MRNKLSFTFVGRLRESFNKLFKNYKFMCLFKRKDVYKAHSTNKNNCQMSIGLKKWAIDKVVVDSSDFFKILLFILD